MKELVRLRVRPSRDGTTFKYFLDFRDDTGIRRQVSLRHADKRKAERQRLLKEQELKIGITVPESMKLSQFVSDNLARTGGQIRESTREEYQLAMDDFIRVVGDVDYQRVAFQHGEWYRQACLDKGNSPATVTKKLRHLKRLFQLAVNRRQLEANPFRGLDMPKWSKKKVNVFKDEDCPRIIKAAQEFCQERDSQIFLRWDLLILLALATGMRRSELLNCTWCDIDLDRRTIAVDPKKDTNATWRWEIKDTDRRVLPLTDTLVRMLSDHLNQQPEGNPYVLVPTTRYDYIQNLRQRGKWKYSDSRKKVVGNFGREFRKVLDRAGVRRGQFHDFRRTALTKWLAGGMRERDVMILAGHSSFATTHQFYLAVADDLVDRARAVSEKTESTDLLRSCCAPADGPSKEKRPTSISPCQP
jgi:integrase